MRKLVGGYEDSSIGKEKPHVQASQNQEFIQHFPPAVRCLAASLKQSFIAILSTYPFFPAFIAKHNTTTTCGIEYALGQLEVTCLDVSPPSLWALFSFLNVWAQQGAKIELVTLHTLFIT